MIQPEVFNTQSVKVVFIIDQNVKIHTILYYLLPTGRNFDKIKRIVLKLQKSVNKSSTTSSDWRLGDYIIVPTDISCGTAKDRIKNQNDDQYCLDCFLCFRRKK